MPFWLGGLIGVVLPDIDHLLHMYLVSPQDPSSMQLESLVKDKKLWRGVEFLYETRGERKELIFHSIFFQAIFFVLTFWVLSSSSSFLGHGLVLSFALHLAVDQLIDLNETKSLENWFKYLPFKLDYDQSKNYWIATTAVTLLMGFLM